MRKSGNFIIELLLAIFICIMTFSLANSLIILLKSNINSSTSYTFVEQQIALTQIRNEISSSNLNSINVSDKIAFQNSSNEQIVYSLYNDRLIKQVNGSGFVVLMFNIKRFTPKQINNSLLIELETRDNRIIIEEIVLSNDP